MRLCITASLLKSKEELKWEEEIMEVEYVTIEREYGSGGTEIAAKLADRCKIACYGAAV